MAMRRRRQTHDSPLIRLGAAFELADPMAPLFKKFRVPPGDYKMLAWELAAEYEPGFKASKAGRPREVPAWLFEEYIAFFTHASRDRSLRKLAEKMHRDFPSVAPPPETLRKHFAKARAIADHRWRVKIAEAMTPAG